MLVINDGKEGFKLSLEVLHPEKQKPVYKVLTIANKSSDKRCAFKIKTNSRERFTTAPHVGVLTPGQRMTVTVCMKALTEEQYTELSANAEASKDKFMISSVDCTDEVTDALLRGKEASAWWESRDQYIQQHVIPCIYQQPGERIEVAQRKIVLVREPVGSGKTAGSKRVIAEEILTLVNNTYKPQAVKVRTTATDRYRVEPSITMIKDGDLMRFKIALIDLNGFNNDRFQIRCAPIPHREGEDRPTEKMVRKSDWWAQPEVKAACYDYMLSSTLVRINGDDITDLEAEKRVVEEEVAIAAAAPPGSRDATPKKAEANDPAKLETETTLAQPFRRGSTEFEDADSEVSEGDG